MEKNLLSSSLQNISFGIILQIVIRAVTFLSNAYVIRFINQDALGLMNVRLLLLESTILFISREAFRRACLDNVKDHKWPLVINLIWLTVPLSLLFSVLFGSIWLLLLESPPPHLQSQYTVGVWVMAASCVIEMLSEAPVLVSNAFLFNKLKVVLNLVHLAVRTIIFLSLVLYSPKHSVHAFSAAQLTATIAFVTGYYIYFHHYFKNMLQPTEGFPFQSIKDFLPTLTKGQWLHRPLAWLTWSLFKTMAVKQLLTEGERYVMTISGVLSLTQQGVYDTVNSLGTLPARLLLRPIEENFYFYFAQLFRRGERVSQLDKTQMTEASKMLYYTLRCVMTFGLIVFIFGMAYSRLLLYLYGGEVLAMPPGPVLLRAHSAAILFLAVNGITEGFGQAAMDKEQLHWYNCAMVLLSVAFLVVSWGFTHFLGGLGFILANCCNMATRICYSLWFMHRQYKGSDWQPLRGLIPGTAISVALVISLCITCTSEMYLYDDHKILHVAVGAACFLVTLFTFYKEEKELAAIIKQKLNIGVKTHSHAD